ncbi:hypothetical protein PISMIDRAFT_26142 [Pisolithus microcarpus 441]|uniref:Dolichol phosphate-mannose biosynthesis regulatory protein n=1 Tax=Pisolithus microcarpus 441 TaxID=765257 RepID=A0A0C9ZYV3_9AGAM|nr:dolichol phosphate-mannose biosynthesis regulatory [Pisolithus microcarpus]KIK31179.1 hypothetical protein PISMIDRAFT_26142 [Pisolithus microcarpus 441]
MALSDVALGGSMLLVAAFVFVYYTTWTILLPFFDISSPIHDYFPAREWAVRLPAFILVVGLSGIGFFVGFTIANEKKKKALKAKLRAA